MGQRYHRDRSGARATVDRPLEIIICTSKVRHPSQAIGEAAAAEATLARGDRLRVYACLWCGGWHLTRRARAWRDRPDQVERAQAFAAIAQEMLAAAGELAAGEVLWPHTSALVPTRRPTRLSTERSTPPAPTKGVREP